MSLYNDLIEQGTESIENYLDVVEKQLAKAYADAYRSAVSELATFYADGIPEGIKEAQKYNRLTNLIKKLEVQVKQSVQSATAITGESSYKSVLDSFENFWYSYEQAYGQVAFGILPVDAIRASVFSEVSGATFVKRYGKLYTSTTQAIAESITRGIALGQSYKKTAEELKGYFNNMLYQSDRVVRTESHRCWVDGANSAYDRADEMGIDGNRVWTTTFDGRTRPSHARMNGVETGKDGLFKTPWGKVEGPGYGPADETINCRCTVYFRLADPELNDEPEWTFNEWQNKYGQKRK